MDIFKYIYNFRIIFYMKSFLECFIWKYSFKAAGVVILVGPEIKKKNILISYHINQNSKIMNLQAGRLERRGDFAVN